MKFIHISDLHIGKRLFDFSLVDDQKYILNSILGIVRKLKPEGVLIAGDIYDSSTPANESYNILDWFLTELSETGTQTFVISGNHDSQDKLSYASGMFGRHGVHIASSPDGVIRRHRIEKDGIAADISLLPFTRPAFVRERHPEVNTYTDAVRASIEEAEIDPSVKNILVAHQFVTDGESVPFRCDSEISVGTLDNVDVSVFDPFDYVALGHLHSSQWVGRETVRYCGTPLKYSRSECGRDKTVTVIDIDDSVTVSEIPLRPLRDVRSLKGPLDSIIAAAKEEREGRSDFIFADLTEPAIDAMDRMRDVFPNTLSVRDVSSEGPDADIGYDGSGFSEETDVRAVFSEFFEKKTNVPLSEEQKEMVEALMQEAGL